MNQITIGRLIASCRKEKNLAQISLAEQIEVTDRAVSIWETGRFVPGVCLT